MGILDSIKKIYAKADQALGGILPGNNPVAAPAAATPQASVYTGAAPYTPAIPTSAYGTSSAQYGQVSPTGKVEVPPLAAPSASSSSYAGGSNAYSKPPKTTAPTMPPPVIPPSTQQPSIQPPTAQPEYRTVTRVNDDGTSTTQKIDPKYSYISQVGKYEFDFWTTEGQEERIRNALETVSPRLTPTAIGGKYVPGVSEATTGVIDALNVALLINAASGIYKAMATMNKIGAVALAPGGAEAIAATIPAAGGIAPTVASTVAPVANTKTVATTIGFLKNILATKNILRTSLVLGGVVGVFSSAAGSAKEKTDIEEEVGDYLPKLREAGMVDMADELRDSVADLRDGWDAVISYLPYIGKNIGSSKIEGIRSKLNKAVDDYDAIVKKEKEQELTAEIAYKTQQQEEQRIYDEQQLAEKRAYEEQQLADKRAYDESQAALKEQQQQQTTEEQRAYNEQQTAEQRAYNEQQQALRDQQAAGLEATATETSQGSTLTFGLLNSAGGKEFVDKDKAAQYYFKAPYEELTPAQKMLLNLLKKE